MTGRGEAAGGNRETTRSTARGPAEVFPPGEFLRAELAERGWTQAVLAEIIGRHPTTVNGVIVGRRGISHDMARVLAAALGTSWRLWIGLDAAYRAAELRDEDDDARIAHRAEMALGRDSVCREKEGDGGR